MRFLSRLFQTKAASALTMHDMHCHLLPGVDDGVKSIDEALTCLQALHRIGYRSVTLTPHIYPEVFDNIEDDLRRKFQDFRETVAAAMPDFKLYLGAEYHCCESFRRKIHSSQTKLLTSGPDDRVILIEFTTQSSLEDADLHIHDLLHRGLQPMVAHGERYPFLQDERGLDILGQWRSRGAILQLNAGSLAGQYGQSVKRNALNLCDHQLVDVIGTDLHKPSHLRWVEQGWSAIHRQRKWQASLRHDLTRPSEAHQAKESS